MSIVTRFGVDLTFLDPGTPSRIEGRGRPGSSTQFQQVHVPIHHRSAHGQVLQTATILVPAAQSRGRTGRKDMTAVAAACDCSGQWLKDRVMLDEWWAIWANMGSPSILFSPFCFYIFARPAFRSPVDIFFLSFWILLSFLLYCICILPHISNCMTYEIYVTCVIDPEGRPGLIGVIRSKLLPSTRIFIHLRPSTPTHDPGTMWLWATQDNLLNTGTKYIFFSDKQKQVCI